jgi:hypothetical protein
MFRAAFTSRSWIAPQSLHVHSLIPSPAIPFGRESGSDPQLEQVWDENASLTSANTTHCLMALTVCIADRLGNAEHFFVAH